MSKIFHTRMPKDLIFYLVIGLAFLNANHALAQPCSNISTLPCNQIVKALPVNLNFNGSQGGLFDGTGGSNGLAGSSLSTGFTMVLPHSKERLNEDKPVRYTSIPGYEPSRIAITGGNLALTSFKGIAFLNRDDSNPSGRTNTQVNTLGVGLQVGANQIIEIQSQLLNITTGANSAQAGIWYGIDEDNFVKLAVVNNSLEFRLETNAISNANHVFTVNNIAGLPGGNIRLKIVVNQAASTINAYYMVNGGAEKQAGSALILPTAIKTGVSINSGAITGVSYAGIFNTHRNNGNNSFVATFDDFSVTQPSAGSGPTFPIQVNFQDLNTTPPVNYFRDFGAPFGLRENGLTYGWLKLADGTPLDLTQPSTGSGRNRNISGVSLLQNTLIHMQGNDVSTWTGNRANEAFWEIALPNGAYLVHVSVGDPTQDGSIAETPIHHINVEGTTAINLYGVNSNAPTGDPSRFTNATVTVTVNDGKLTINADHPSARNTKINAVEISPASSGTPSLFFAASSQNLTLQANSSSSTLSNTIATTNNTSPSVKLTAIDAASNVPQWIKVNGALLNGSVTHNTAEPEIVFQYNPAGLAAGTYTASITASANGFTSASFTAQLTITTPPNPGNINFPVQVNFQDQSTTPPTGYLKDYGQSYGPRDNSLTYGWVTANGSKTPLTLIGNGRNRNENGFNVEENTLLHMQYNHVNGGNGVTQEGIWEIALPNGIYEVNVTLGDASKEVLIGTHHIINAEGVNIVNYVAVQQNANIQSNGKLINVMDGKLTLDAIGGFNTKINGVVIQPFTSTQPFIVGLNIADGATGVDVTTSISSSSIYFPNVGKTIDDNTVNDNTVFLRKVDNGTKVTVSSLNSTGGGDAITLTPAEALQAFTEYEFVVTNGLKDLAGVSFLPFSSTFTTGPNSVGSGNPAVFTKQVVATGIAYTALRIGPDNKLYGLTNEGSIHRWTINADGTLASRQIITSLQVAEGGNRLAVGMAFDPASTSTNPILWVSHTTFGFNDMPDWGGKISKLSGANLETVKNYVTNLPRSIRDHVTNNVSFKPGENGSLYIMQGSNTAMGLPDVAWGNRPERLLNGAVLKLDIAKAEAAGLPVNVQTEEGGTYNPYAASAPLTIFATGTRNAFSMLWHSNGQLYVPTNGSAGGGHTPSGKNDLNPITPNTQSDFLYRVVQGGYYGHPNPARNEWILNGGNKTAVADGPDDVPEYTIGTQPEANYRGFSYDFGKNKSPNGVIEYKSNVFNGALQGKLMVIRYSQNDDIIVLTPGGANKDIVNAETRIEGFYGFNDPLDLVEHLPTGNIYISEYGGGKVTLLKPSGSSVPVQSVVVTPAQVVVDDVSGGSAAPPRTVTITNNTASSVSITGITISGQNANQFSLNLTGFNTTLPAGQASQFKVVYNPTALGPMVAQATINISGASPIVVPLKGLGRAGAGGDLEPSLQWVMDTYFGTSVVNVGDDNPATTTIHSNAASAAQPTLGSATGIQKFQKAGPGPVTLEPLAVFGVANVNPVVRFGWYLAGNAGSKVELFTVGNSPSSNAQTLNPVISGSTTFDPGDGTLFGFTTEWPYFSNRKVYSEDALNTFSGAIPNHVKVYAMPGETNAYIVTTEENPTGYDYNDIIMVVRNVKPFTGTAGPVIALENMNKIPGSNIGFPADDWYVFHRTKFSSVNARTATMRIRNTGNTPLSITGLVISNTSRFKILSIDGVTYNTNQLPISIAAGAYKDVKIDFQEGSGAQGIREETLTIQSNAVNKPSWVVPLKATYMEYVEGNNEVNSQQIMQVLGFTTSMNGQPRPSSDYPTDQDVNNGVHGDMILSKYFKQADPAQPIRAIKAAAFKSPGASTTKLIRTDNNTVVGTFTYTWEAGWHQTLFPKDNASTGVAGKSVNSIGASFRIIVDGYKTSGGNNKDELTDQILGVRVYKVLDRNGKIIPYHYIVIQDYIGTGCGAGSANCDWNDNMEYFINIKPVDDPFIASKINDYSAPSGTLFTYPVAGNFNIGYAGNKLTYMAKIAGSAAPLPNWLTLNPTTGVFSGIPPSSTTSSTLSIAVTATDLNGIEVFNASNSTFVLTITGSNPNLPIANAGPDQTKTDSDNNGSENVTLNGSGSSDANGIITSYVWKEGTTQIATGVSPTVSLSVGTHNITLTVTDNHNNTASDLVVITVNPGSGTTNGQQLVSFTLVDAITDQPIPQFNPIQNGAVINLATLANKQVNILANTNPTIIGSVVMQLSGAVTRTQKESTAPYTLFGDTNGDYNNWSPPVGNYTLTGTPYTQSGGNGQAGTAKVVNFSVVNNTANQRTISETSKEKISDVIDIQEGISAIQAYPNPMEHTLNIKIGDQLMGKTTVQLSDPTGRILLEYNYTVSESDDIIVLDLAELHLSSGLYFLKINPENSPGTTLRVIKQ